MANTIVIRELPSQNGIDLKFGQMDTDIQNGAIVDLGKAIAKDVFEAENGEHYIVCGVELMYEAGKMLGDYINKANHPFRVERLIDGACWAVSCTGLYADKANAEIEVGDKVGVSGGKLTFGSGTMGEVVDVYYKGDIKFISFMVRSDMAVGI